MLKNNPLIERLNRLHEKRMSGRLALTGRDGEEITLHLYDGFIDAITSSDEDDRLGQALVREGLVDDRELTRLLARAEETPLGETVVRERIITPALLIELMSNEARLKLARAVDGKYGLGSFDQQAEQFLFPMRLTPQQILLDLVRRNGVSYEPRHERERLQLRGDVDITAVRWSPQELATLNGLRGLRTLDELIADTHLEESSVRKTLRALEEMGALTHREAEEEQEATTALAPAELLPLERIVPVERSLVFDEKVELAVHGSPIVSEYFKSLKVRLDEYMADTGAKIFSITSPHVEDGKSLISSNLALCMGEDPGRRVLLLDCDLRRPSVHRQFGITMGPGLTHYLLEEGLPAHCYLRRIGSIFAMTAGQIADNPIALFSLSRMQELLDYAREEFDTVIIDSPPMMPISDARVISNMADGSLLVIRRGKTPFNAIEKALTGISQERLVGTVLNEVPQGRFNAYYSSYAYSSYYYGDQSKEGIIELKSGGSDWTELKRTRK